MLEGLYSAAAGMAAQQTRLDAVANDIANVSTHGYKKVRTSFRDLVYQPAGQGAAGGITTGSGAAAVFAGRSFGQGALQDTGQPLDVALSGPGFIQVRRPDGTLALTRNGVLGLDAQGRLVTSTGDVVQPPVTVPQGVEAADLAIAPDGRISAGDRELGRIEIVTVRAPEALRSVGDSQWVATAESGAPEPADGTEVLQGKLETSNVDLGEAMVEMLDSQRSFELASRAIRVQDEMWEMANGVKR